jgi:hypothetical protein
MTVDELQDNVDARYSTLINVSGDQNNYYTFLKDNVAGMHVSVFLTQLYDILLLQTNFSRRSTFGFQRPIHRLTIRMHARSDKLPLANGSSMEMNSGSGKVA